MVMNCEIRSILWDSPDYQQELLLRDQVLRRPLGLSLYAEDLIAEEKDIHLGAFFSGELIGVLILTEQLSGQVKMRQVAVAEAYRGMGVGKALVLAAERLCSGREVVLAARATAVGFYEALGYVCCSEKFTEVTIPHQRMQKYIPAITARV